MNSGLKSFSGPEYLAASDLAQEILYNRNKFNISFAEMNYKGCFDKIVSAPSFSCGKSTSKNFDTEGIYPSSVTDSPWHVGIYFFNDEKQFKNICSGTIINLNTVITAASCVARTKTHKADTPSKYKVVAGKQPFEWEVADRNAQENDVKEIFIDDSYRGDRNQYSRNIAILGLTHDFIFNDFVRPVCLDFDKARIHKLEQDDPKLLQTSGWGFTSEWSESLTFKKVVLSYIKLRQCREQFSSSKHISYVTSDKVCVNTEHGRQDWDTGAGVMLYTKGTYYIYGVLSVNFDNEFSVATKVTKYIPWIDNVIANISHTERCEPTEFTCHNGQCVREQGRCDGVEDCDDGSDEHEQHCPQAKDPSKFCLLPNQKGGVSYKLENCNEKENNCLLKGNTRVPEKTIAEIHCGVGFDIADKACPKVTCINGELFPYDVNCIKLCPQLAKENVITHCKYNGVKTSCPKYSRPRTELHYKCAEFYYISDSAYFSAGMSECSKEGEWRGGLPNCVPRCGIANRLSQATTVIALGSNAKSGLYPWHVGLYLRSNDRESYTQICGGSLVKPAIVLTAAHCLHEKTTEKPYAVESLAIAAGKYYRSWEEHEPAQQTRMIKQTVTKNSYQGYKTSYIHDIALIKLDSPFQLNSHVLPVCLPSALEPNLSYFNGTLVGWGMNEKGKYSETLQEIELPVIPNEKCVQEFSKYLNIISYDKYCSYFVNGAGPGVGDSGGGMIYNRNNVYFIQGIVSIKPNDNSFAAFTNITEHLKWINDNIKLLASD